MSRRAVVIGASGGIGAALAARLEGQGWEVERLARTGATPIDLTSETSIAAAAEEVGRRGGVERVLVATGLLHGEHAAPEKTYRDLSAHGLAEYFAVNASGPALVAKHFVPLLPRAEPGLFAALSARVGSIGDNRLGGWYGYRASKAALNMVVKCLAIELARTRPQLVCVGLHPGTVDTRLSKPFQRGVPPEKLFTPEFSAERLLEVLEGLTPAESGGCYDWSGERIEP